MLEFRSSRNLKRAQWRISAHTEPLGAERSLVSTNRWEACVERVLPDSVAAA